MHLFVTVPFFEHGSYRRHSSSDVWKKVQPAVEYIAGSRIGFTGAHEIYRNNM
jgi:hypothetical protein